MPRYILIECEKCGKEHKELLPATSSFVPPGWATGTVSIDKDSPIAPPFAPIVIIWCKECWRSAKAIPREG